MALKNNCNHGGNKSYWLWSLNKRTKTKIYLSHICRLKLAVWAMVRDREETAGGAEALQGCAAPARGAGVVRGSLPRTWHGPRRHAYCCHSKCRHAPLFVNGLENALLRGMGRLFPRQESLLFCDRKPQPCKSSSPAWAQSAPASWFKGAVWWRRHLISQWRKREVNNFPNCCLSAGKSNH